MEIGNRPSDRRPGHRPAVRTVHETVEFPALLTASGRLAPLLRLSRTDRDDPCAQEVRYGPVRTAN